MTIIKPSAFRSYCSYMPLICILNTVKIHKLRFLIWRNKRIVRPHNCYPVVMIKIRTLLYSPIAFYSMQCYRNSNYSKIISRNYQTQVLEWEINNSIQWRRCAVCVFRLILKSLKQPNLWFNSREPARGLFFLIQNIVINSYYTHEIRTRT